MGGAFVYDRLGSTGEKQVLSVWRDASAYTIKPDAFYRYAKLYKLLYVCLFDASAVKKKWGVFRLCWHC